MKIFPNKPKSVLFDGTVGTLIEAAKSGSVSRFIGRSRSEDSVCNSPNNRNESASHSNSPNSDEAVTESPTDSNPSLDKPDVEHKHHQQSSSSSHHPTEQHRNNSNVHSPQSNSNNSHKKEHHHLHMHLNFGALAALKRKRKKFSNSRNESPVLEPPPENASPTSSLKKSIKKVITFSLCE